MNSPLVAIVGPTASGKSALAMEIAERYGGEIIAADSRTVYRGMDIGTAKPSVVYQQRVPHHCLDLAEPGTRFTAADFQVAAGAAIKDIHSRGKLPILVGGTGLYANAVLYDYTFPGSFLKCGIYSTNIEELQKQVDELGLTLNQSDYHNPRRLMRAIETAGQPRSKSQLRSNALVVGLNPGRGELESRIASRIDTMIKAGFVDEVRQLLQVYGSDSEAMTGIGYRAFAGYVEGTKSLNEAKSEFIRGDINLAKRQMTWFKRNPDIHWIADPADAQRLVEEFLASRAFKPL